jgi:glycosyltransferase involved in cell wall biosynthesis
VRVLFTSPVLEHPAAGGPQLRIENSIKALHEVTRLDIVSRSPVGLTGGEGALNFYRGFTQTLEVAPSARRLSTNRYLRKAQRLLRGVGGRDTDADARFIVSHARRHSIGLVWFGYGNISFPLIKRVKFLAPDLKLICDTDSVWSRFIMRELPYARGWRRTRIARAGLAKEKEERESVNLCDITTAVSGVDADYYRGIASSPAKICVFANVIDLSSYRNPPPAAAGLKKPCIYLAGTFGHRNSPMDTAARWVIEEIMPILQSSVPNLHFYIVGTGSERTLARMQSPHITVTGKLPSVLPYLCHADVAIVPLKFESGTRFKILEAGACGIPVVSTTLGAEGLPVASGRELMLADDPTAFANAILKVIADRNYAETLATHCRQMVHNNFSIETLTHQANHVLAMAAR